MLDQFVFIWMIIAVGFAFVVIAGFFTFWISLGLCIVSLFDLDNKIINKKINYIMFICLWPILLAIKIWTNIKNIAIFRN